MVEQDGSCAHAHTHAHTHARGEAGQLQDTEEPGRSALVNKQPLWENTLRPYNKAIVHSTDWQLVTLAQGNKSAFGRVAHFSRLCDVGTVACWFGCSGQFCIAFLLRPTQSAFDSFTLFSHKELRVE